MASRILIVDDEEVILFAMRDYFTVSGWAVDCARALQEAESLLERFDYDVLIADVCLTAPGSMEGLELVRQLKRRNRSTRAILLSAYLSSEMEDEARRRGVDLLLLKPQPLPELARILRESVRQQEPPADESERR